MPEQAALPEPKASEDTMRDNARREYVKDKVQIKQREERIQTQEPETISAEPPKTEQSNAKTSRVKTGNAYSDTAKKTKVLYKKNPATKTAKETAK